MFLFKNKGDTAGGNIFFIDKNKDSQSRKGKQYLCSLQFLSPHTLLKNYSAHGTSNTKQLQVLSLESEEKTAWSLKNMLKGILDTDKGSIIETEGL